MVASFVFSSIRVWMLSKTGRGLVVTLPVAGQEATLPETVLTTTLKVKKSKHQTLIMIFSDTIFYLIGTTRFEIFSKFRFQRSPSLNDLRSFPPDPYGHLIPIEFGNFSRPRPTDLKRLGTDQIRVEGHIVRSPGHCSILSSCRVRNLVLTNGFDADVVGSSGY